MQSNQCQLFEPHEPLVILVEYNMCSLLQFHNTPGMLMMIIGMRTIAMSIRFEVNQSMLSLCGASFESVVYFMLSFFMRLCDIYYVPLCNKHCNGTFEICLLMCATVSRAHMSLLCILFCS